MQATARAKVNLYLHVVGRRDDGYHLLDSLVVFPDAADRLFAAPAGRLTLQIEGPFAETLAGPELDNNLVLRAARMLMPPDGPGAALRLEKHLPVASGIGGGSADAAATLRLLAALWQTGHDPASLTPLAMTLGADVPVCLASVPARMGGIGEVLQPAPALPPFGILLVNPRVAVSTPEVFRSRPPGVRPPADLPPAWPDATTMAHDLACLANDLEPPARRLCPAIDPVLDWIATRPHCLLARMSGSGATCFGLFPTAAAARAALPAPAPWWAWAGPGTSTPRPPT